MWSVPRLMLPRTFIRLAKLTSKYTVERDDTHDQQFHVRTHKLFRDAFRNKNAWTWELIIPQLLPVRHSLHYLGYGWLDHDMHKRQVEFEFEFPLIIFLIPVQDSGWRGQKSLQWIRIFLRCDRLLSTRHHPRFLLPDSVGYNEVSNLGESVSVPFTVNFILSRRSAFLETIMLY